MVSIRLPEDMRDAVDAWAKQHGVPRSIAIRRWIEQGLEKEAQHHAVVPGERGNRVRHGTDDSPALGTPDFSPQEKKKREGVEQYGKKGAGKTEYGEGESPALGTPPRAKDGGHNGLSGALDVTAHAEINRDWNGGKRSGYGETVSNVPRRDRSRPPRPPGSRTSVPRKHFNPSDFPTSHPYIVLKMLFAAGLSLVIFACIVGIGQRWVSRAENADSFLANHLGSFLNN
jgi:predicted DNA-binding protein